MSLKPWREVAEPHPDVLSGTFLQSEFAADISAVQRGAAPAEYQDAKRFFERTYITEGMRLLLGQVVQRLSGRGGEPVVQLQTAFGGGKTHTMLAVFHLATRTGALQELAGISALLDHAGVVDVPRARVAILDGNAHSPAQPWSHEGVAVHTLWGELAWQLGGQESYKIVEESDKNGISPGKDALRTLLARHAPCVVLIDELVAYVRQFPDNRALSGGTYDSNLSFVQALTEAVKQVPSAMLLASLPESEIEAGSSSGVQALRALEKTFGRVQALWKPVASEESFEIVRRRLFQPIVDLSARDASCRAFAELYLQEGSKLPPETQEMRYSERLRAAYPIHPDVFDRLYEDWSTLENFQRTRGVLKLMAHVIHELWAQGNRDLLILPSSLPLYRGKARDELVSHLQPGWDPVLTKDIDEADAGSVELDTHEARFGAVQAARRVARTIFFGSAPSSRVSKQGARGVDRAHVLLGCLQPGQSASLYVDALSRLSDRLHYLNTSGETNDEGTHFWFDTRANLRREMESRKGSLSDKEVREKIAQVLRALSKSRGIFDGVHVLVPHSDVPDDAQLRLVILDPQEHYGKAHDVGQRAVQAYVAQSGERPRFRGNRLLFLAADTGSLGRLQEATKTALAWRSITGDIQVGRLNIDRLQEGQAKKEEGQAERVLSRAARECYRWLLCPVKHAPTDRALAVEAFSLNAAAPSLSEEIERVCQENELVIGAWSPIHLRAQLQSLYWKEGAIAAPAMKVWEDMLRYLYLPRLRDRSVFAQAIQTGAQTADFFGIAYGERDEKFEGFSFGATPGQGVQLDDTLLLIEPEAARAYAAQNEALPQEGTSSRPPGSPGSEPSEEETRPSQAPKRVRRASGALSAKRFYGSVEVNASMAKMALSELADEVISHLTRDPHAKVKVVVEIEATFEEGAKNETKRVVSENAAQLCFKAHEWE